MFYWDQPFLVGSCSIGKPQPPQPKPVAVETVDPMEHDLNKHCVSFVISLKVGEDGFQF